MDNPSSSQSLAIDVAPSSPPPIVASVNDRIRPLLDCVDRLRHLNIMQEAIQLPTIVVVDDQSSGKSSVLESLRDKAFALDGKSVDVDEVSVADAIILATDEIAGHGKGISNKLLTLVVQKNGVPDLTMVDLPGITRVPVQGQPDDIYEQISDIIKTYISPQESIILNVLSATVDFPTCESIRMSQKVDKTGERTLAVVTKVDKAPEGLLEKVTADEVNIGLGYICVRNRIGKEFYEAARKNEAGLFENHPLLSKIDKSMVGIPVLAQKLVSIQATIISKSLPDIERKINDKLATNLAELNRLPQHLSSMAGALTAFMRILSSFNDSLKKILLRGEFDEYPEEKEMHCTTRLVEMLYQFSDELHAKNFDGKEDFLMEEIRALEETNWIGLPNFLPRHLFLNVLQKRVKEVAAVPEDFVGRVWDYIERIVMKVLMHHCENYPQLQSSARRAAHNLIAKKNESVDWIMNYPRKGSVVNLNGLGDVDAGHLRKHLGLVQQAFDMKMSVVAYWKIVLMRLVDSMALHIMHTIQNMINKDMEEEIVQELMAPRSGGIKRMLDESPVVAEKCSRLKKSVKLLMESNEVVSNIMGRISYHGDQERD
ncbi:Dynamin-related protein 4C [Capsicum annuum]|nr:Dynamin-related protein 4C [Capsicum annuum]KAF3680378.1 Dynamin-related protein 4C [Capsicum annuum]